MNRIANWKITLVSLALFASPAIVAADDRNAVDGPNVRVTKHEDGGETIFTRSPDKRTLTKKTYTGGGNLSMVTVYRMDANGNPMSCKIIDGQQTELFKVSYGYRKSDGLLVEERMFDARVKRIDPADGKEMPVQRLIYLYDAQGNRSKPIALNLLPGKTFEEVYGAPNSALDTDPFDDEKQVKPANPNARGVGRGN